MKKLIILFTLLALLGSGCNKDFLDRNPKDAISTAIFWKSTSDLDKALTACYASLKDGGAFDNALPMWDNITDNSYGQHFNDFYGTNNFVQGTVNSTSGGF